MKTLRTLVLALFLLSLPALACGGSSTVQRAPASSSPHTMTLHCPECAETGMAANIWADVNMQRGKCTLPWGDTVRVLETSSANGGMARISHDNCEGWIRTSLLK